MVDAKLVQKTQQLRQQKDSALNEALSLRERNRANIEAFKKDLAEVKKERELRNKENEAVKKLKPRRAELQKQANELRKQISEKIAKLRELGGAYTSGIEKRLEQLDYLLHFEGTSPKREKEIAEESKALAKQLKGSKEADAVRKELNELRDKLRPIWEEGEKVHSELVGHARASDGHHAKTVKLSAEIDSLSKKITEGIGELDKKFGALGHAREEYGEARKMLDQKFDEERGKYEAEREREFEEEHAVENARKEKQMSAVQKKAAAAQEKLKKGGKLSFEEFQLLQLTSN